MKWLPGSAFYQRNGRPRNPCRESAKAYSYRRVERTGRDGTVHERTIRIVRSASGGTTRAVCVPPVIYGALVSPGAMRWIIRDGQVSMEVVRTAWFSGNPPKTGSLWPRRRIARQNQPYPARVYAGIW